MADEEGEEERETEERKIEIKFEQTKHAEQGKWCSRGIIVIWLVFK